MTTLLYKMPKDDDFPSTCPVCKTDLATPDSIYVPLKLYASRTAEGDLLLSIPPCLEDEIVTTELECAKCGEYV